MGPDQTAPLGFIKLSYMVKIALRAFDYIISICIPQGIIFK